MVSVQFTHPETKYTRYHPPPTHKHVLLLIQLLERERAAGQSPGPYGTLLKGTGGYKTDRQNSKVWTRVVRVVKYFKYPAENLLLTFRRVAKSYYSRFVE